MNKYEIGGIVECTYEFHLGNNSPTKNQIARVVEVVSDIEYEWDEELGDEVEVNTWNVYKLNFQEFNPLFIYSDWWVDEGFLILSVPPVLIDEPDESMYDDLI